MYNEIKERVFQQMMDFWIKPEIDKRKSFDTAKFVFAQTPCFNS